MQDYEIKIVTDPDTGVVEIDMADSPFSGVYDTEEEARQHLASFFRQNLQLLNELV